MRRYRPSVVVAGDSDPVKSAFARRPESIIVYSTADLSSRNEVGFRAWLHRQPDGTKWAEMDPAN